MTRAAGRRRAAGRARGRRRSPCASSTGTATRCSFAVDLPNVGVPLLELLRDWPGAPTAVPEAGGRLQPVCARYGPAALLAASSLVVGGVRALHALLDVVDYDVVPEATWRAIAPPDAFDDVDTPDDATRLGIELPGLRVTV